jgi:hypothetical protein
MDDNEIPAEMSFNISISPKRDESSLDTFKIT